MCTISFNHSPKCIMETHFLDTPRRTWNGPGKHEVSDYLETNCGHDDSNCIQAAADVLEGALLHVSRWSYKKKWHCWNKRYAFISPELLLTTPPTSSNDFIKLFQKKPLLGEFQLETSANNLQCLQFGKFG